MKKMLDLEEMFRPLQGYGNDNVMQPEELLASIGTKNFKETQTRFVNENPDIFDYAKWLFFLDVQNTAALNLWDDLYRHCYDDEYRDDTEKLQNLNLNVEAKKKNIIINANEIGYPAIYADFEGLHTAKLNLQLNSSSDSDVTWISIEPDQFFEENKRYRELIDFEEQHFQSVFKMLSGLHIE